MAGNKAACSKSSPTTIRRAVPWFFDHASGLLALVAGMFVITWLQRTNELTALMAAGITTKRIVRPLLAAAVVISLVAAANRELVIPEVRDKLVRNAQDWLGETARKVDAVTDNRTDILIGGRASFAAEQRIQEPTFTLHRRHGEFGRKLIAENAFYHAPTADRPGGYLLEGVTQPEKHAELASVSLDGQPVILSPLDTDWLEPDELFVVSDGLVFRSRLRPPVSAVRVDGRTGAGTPQSESRLWTPHARRHARAVCPAFS